MYIPGTAGIVVFYSTILGITIWSVFTKRKKLNNKSLDYLILGNRNIGLILGISTLVATWSGRVFIYSTVETIFSKNLTWCQVPIGYSLSLIFGVILFIKPIRNDKKFLTILDPFQQEYGPRLGSLLFIPTLFSDIFWCASIIKALSNTISLIFKIDSNISISVGLIVVITYTILGGIYKTSIADVVQVIFLIVGLGIATPYVILNPAVVSLEKNFIKNNNDWLGEVAVEDLADWIDHLLLLTFGGLSCQSYFQQMMSIKSTSNAKIVSIVSMLICLALTLPSVLIGLAAREINWSLIDDDDDDNSINKTSLKIINSDDTNNGSILAIILKYLTPQWVGFISLGAISASVISSSTSSILASSLIFVRNIYKIIIRPKASDNELLWILKITIVLITFMSGGIVFSIGNASVYYLSYLASDFTYVLLFPQLLGVIYWPSLIDTYGYLAGYLISIIMRIAGGEKKLGLWPPLINYPLFDNQTRNQKFPFRTLIVISSIIIQLLVSFITKSIFTQHNNTGDGNHKKTYCPKCCDFLGIYSLSGKKVSKKQSSVAQSSSGAALILDDSAITQEGSLRDGCDSTDSQEELTATLVDNNYHHQYNQNNHHHHHQQQQLHQDSSLISKKIFKESNNAINFNNFKGEHTLRRGMSVQNTPVTRVDRSAFSKNSTQTPGRNNNNNNNNNNNLDSEQILAVRNLIPVSCYLKTTNESPNNINLLNHSNNNNNNNNNTATVPSTPSFSNQSHNNLTNSSNVIYGKLESIKITKDKENKASGVILGDRSFLELNLNHNLNNLKEGKVESGSGVGVSVVSSSSSSSLLSTGIVKKNVVGVKLVGMDGMTMTTLRRPSQSTFSPTPSVELVNILDNKKQCRTTGESSVSGPISLSPTIPTSTLGVEACKIHGTSVDGSGNDHCRIKRGIVRHHSFNETGDRTLTTLARQPAYPSMPLRTEDCRMTVLMTNKKDRKTSASHIVRYSSVSDEKEHSNRFITSSTGVTGVGSRRGLVISPTYGIYGSTITPTDINYSTTFTYNKNDNNDDYHDDQDNNEAISKF